MCDLLFQRLHSAGLPAFHWWRHTYGTDRHKNAGMQFVIGLYIIIVWSVPINLKKEHVSQGALLIRIKKFSLVSHVDPNDHPRMTKQTASVFVIPKVEREKEIVRRKSY
jgi:hypothetical protein